MFEIENLENVSTEEQQDSDLKRFDSTFKSETLFKHKVMNFVRLVAISLFNLSIFFEFFTLSFLN